MKRVLVDSNIFLDYYLDRKDNLLPLGEFAFQFVKRAIGCEFLILICDLILQELEDTLKIKQELIQKTIFSELNKKHKLLFMQHNKELAYKAKRMAIERSLPTNDCLFALMAKENNAIVISMDKHFEKLTDIVEFFKPEEL